MFAGALGILFSSLAFVQTDALPEVLSLKLFNLHTHERATIVFKRNGVYDREGLKQLDYFLRDWRQDKIIHMDPHLFDLIYQVYRKSGSNDYINVVCGFRSPPTNAMLRRRSRGVAQNSLHMQGKAMDFFIPGVPLAKLRAIGLQMQLGGVGFYPTSGSPFVHMDTGNVRHWPRMTRQQLVAVFPNGRTLHVPSDGKPLPGYAEAQAAYKTRIASRTPIGSYQTGPSTEAPAIRVAYTDTPNSSGGGGLFNFGGSDATAVADASTPDTSDDGDVMDVAAADSADTVTAPPTATGKPLAVAVAAYATAPTPMPHLAPRPTASPPLTVATAAAAPAPQRGITAAAILASAAQRIGAPAPSFDFGPAQNWAAPAVPAALARAMAERDTSRAGASLPITPTAVVATIDVNRPLRAAAITGAVLRTNTSDADATVPTVLAYAAPEPPPAPRTASMTTAGVPLPQLSPLDRERTGSVAVVKPPKARVRPRLDTPALTMTALDTQGLRMWIGPTSTRQKPYALLTMPDFAQTPDLMKKPDLAFSAGFAPTPYANLRTDSFSGPLVQQPDMVDLTANQQVASIQ